MLSVVDEGEAAVDAGACVNAGLDPRFSILDLFSAAIRAIAAPREAA
jgi:hypothetical protein